MVVNSVLGKESIKLQINEGYNELKKWFIYMCIIDIVELSDIREESWQQRDIYLLIIIFMIV